MHVELISLLKHSSLYSPLQNPSVQQQVPSPASPFKKSLFLALFPLGICPAYSGKGFAEPNFLLVLAAAQLSANFSSSYTPIRKLHKFSHLIFTATQQVEENTLHVGKLSINTQPSSMLACSITQTTELLHSKKTALRTGFISDRHQHFLRL